MASEVFVVVADTVRDTGEVSFKFMAASPQLQRIRPGHFGTVTFRDGHWAIFVGKGSTQVLASEGGDSELHEAILAAPDCALLMDAATFSPFQRACRKARVRLKHYRHNGVLSTS